MGPGGLHKNRLFEDCVGGATGYIDRLILGHFMHQYSRIEVYTPAVYEHAGIVGTTFFVYEKLIKISAYLIS